MNLEFWTGRRVLVTGHTGFKGSWLALWLHHLGALTTGYSLPPPTDPNLFLKANVGATLHSVNGDMRDLEHLREVMHNSQPEVVLHLAAQSLVGLSYVDPVQTYSTNVMGTVNLFEAVRSCSSVRAVVNVTTDKCYENRDWVWGYRENDALGGFDPYSNSKACSEMVSEAFRSSFFNPLTFDKHRVAVSTARAGNVIGGGDWAANRLIPDLVSAFMQEVPATIRNPNSIRPWQHVLEPIRGYLMLAERMVESGSQFGGAWNFGPRSEDARPVKWMADQLCSAWGQNAAWHPVLNEMQHEAATLKLDTSKSDALLGWSPALTLQESLEMIVEWSKGYQAGNSPQQLTLNQIHQYQERLKKNAK